MPQPNARVGNDERPGHAGNQDVSPLSREIRRRLLLAVPGLRRIGQSGREFFRRVSDAPHRIDFFHQVDDPYSALALQAITQLREHYDVEFRFHLVSQIDRVYAPEPELLAAYARRDCGRIAPHYGLHFPIEPAAPRTTVCSAWKKCWRA